MPSYEIGTLIRKLRKQKGISQEDLAYPILDRSTLSKIERGKATPHTKTLEYLLERLGLDHSELIKKFLAPDDLEAHLVVEELTVLLSTVVRSIPPEDKKIFSNKVSGLIEQLESNQEFAAHPLNRQFILDARARLAFNLKEDDKAAALAKEALEIVVPNFCEKDIGSYYLNRTCMNMINLLALIHNEAGRFTEAIDILYGLKEYIYNTYNELRARANDGAPAIMNLAMTLVKANRPQEAYDLCEEGIQLCLKSRVYFFFKGLAWQQARALFKLGKVEEGVELSRKLYYAFDVHRDDFGKNFIQETVLAETGIDVGKPWIQEQL